MTAEEAKIEESPGLVKRVTSTAGETFDSLKDKAPKADEVRSAIGDQTAKLGDAFDSLRSKAPTTEEVRSAVSDQAAKASDAYDRAKGTVGLRDYVEMSRLFQAWLPTLTKADGLPKKARAETLAAIDHVAGLPESEMKPFVRHLTSFCRSFGFELEWLIEPETSKQPDESLRQSMGEIVDLYCLAHWKAAQMQDGVEAFTSLQKWMARPFAKRYAEFNQHLFSRLVAEGLIPAPPLELFLAPEEEREEYSVGAIKGLLAEDSARFYKILRSHVAVVEAEPTTEADEDSEQVESDAVESE